VTLKSVSKPTGFIYVVVLAASASSIAIAQEAPISASIPWQPNHISSAVNTIQNLRHEAMLNGDTAYTLGQLIDVAEDNNPATHAAWNRSQIAAASLGIARSELYPTLIAASAGRTFLNPPLLYQSFALQDIGAFESTLTLNYTLLDFGARRDEISAAKARLLASNLSFNNEQLALIQTVSTEYYRLLNATGQREAAEFNLHDAQAVEDSANDHKQNGLATLPDVLEAKAATAKATYELQNAIGMEQMAFGDLATTLTVTPVKHFRVQTLTDLQIPEELNQSVENAIETSFSTRPDLLAGAERVQAAEAEVKHARSAYYPKLVFDGSKGWLRAWGQQEKYPGTYGKTFTYDAKLSLTWTVFDGFKRENTLSRAKAERAAVQEELREKEDKVTDQVWAAYTDAQTALRERQAATSLLLASNESYSAAVESYKDGVRTILDVLSAERDLAHARAVDVSARTQVLQAFMNLAFRTGDLLTTHLKGKQP
jgi:outer membrane protein